MLANQKQTLGLRTYFCDGSCKGCAWCRGMMVSLFCFYTKGLSRGCPRENYDGRALDFGAEMQICGMKSVFTIGAQIQALGPKFTREIFTFQRTNIFLNCMFPPEGRHPLAIFADSVMIEFFFLIVPFLVKMCRIHKIVEGGGFFCWFACPKPSIPQ